MSEKCPELSELAIETVRLPSSTIAPEVANSTDEKPIIPFGFLKNSQRGDADQLERHSIIHYNQRFWPEQDE